MADAMLAMARAMAAIKIKAARGHPAGAVVVDLLGQEIKELVELAVARLLERDSPSLETVKMQVSFDTAYVEQEAVIQKSQGAKEAQLKDMLRTIVEMQPESSSDFESLTALYRLIFKYLLRHDLWHGWKPRAWLHPPLKVHSPALTSD